MEIIVMMNDNWAVKDNNIVRPVTRSTVFLFKSAADTTVARRVVADKREAGRMEATKEMGRVGMLMIRTIAEERNRSGGSQVTDRPDMEATPYTELLSD